MVAAPRAKSKKVRKYEHFDITHEFELRKADREKEKRQAIEAMNIEFNTKRLELKDLAKDSDQKE